MPGNERESPTRGIGFESWKSTTDLCKELWRTDYGEEIPEEVLRTIMKLTSAILETQAARCRAEIAAMFPVSHYAEASTHKHEVESVQNYDKTTTQSAALYSRRDTHDAQVNGSLNSTDSPQASPVLAVQPILDTLKVKRRWYRKFEAEISEIQKRQLTTAPQPILDILKSVGVNPGSREQQKEAHYSECVENDGKHKKKSVRFLSSSPEIIDSSAKSTKTKKSAELLSISIRNSNAAQNSLKHRKLNFHEELHQEEDKIHEADKKTTVAHSKTRKRKSEDDGNTETKVIDEKKKKLEEVHPKRMPLKFSLKKKVHQSRQKVSLGVKDIFADMGLENIDFKAADMEVEVNMRDAAPPTIGPYRIVPQTQENRRTNGTPYQQPQPEQTVITQGETEGDGEMAQASIPQYNIAQPITSPTHIDSSEFINYIDTSQDPMVADWLLNYTATPSSSPAVASASNGNTVSSLSVTVTPVRSPYYIDGITGEEVSFGPMPRITTEPPATAIRILPPWPSRHRQQPEFQPINVVGGINVDSSPAHWARGHAKDEDADKSKN